MKVFIYLKSPVKSFDMQDYINEMMLKHFSGFDIETFERFSDMTDRIDEPEIILTWVFKKELYGRASKLKELYTPAAGNDWVPDDPNHRVDVNYGTFHGPMMAESLIGNILYFSHHTPAVLANQQDHRWDRSAQEGIRLLKDQTVLIIGYGNIGRTCAKLLIPFGCHIIGLKRSISSSIDEYGVECITQENIYKALERSDHVVLILPSGASTDGFFTREYFTYMKSSGVLYNIGRGNSIKSNDITWALTNKVIAGAALDVFEEEPLPEKSPLWDTPNLFITPHSSCVFQNYKSEFFNEVYTALRDHLN